MCVCVCVCVCVSPLHERCRDGAPDYVCVCVCVWGGERERVCVSVCVYVCIIPHLALLRRRTLFVCVYVRGREIERERE